MDKKLSFGVEGFDILDDFSDEQLAIVEVEVCHDGNNLHDMPIDLSVIKKAKKTLKNKFLVAGFDGEDFEGHEVDEQIVGFFPESSIMKFSKKNGRTYLVAQAIMSKVYAKWAYDIFANDKDNHRAVSMEITVLKSEVMEDGLEHILSFVFNGVTLLGNDRTPACEGAGASIVKFSKEDAIEVYSNKRKKSKQIKQNFANNLRKEDGEDMDEKEKLVNEEEKENEIVEVVDDKVSSDKDAYMNEEEVHEEEVEAKEEVVEEVEEHEEEHEEKMEEISNESLTNNTKYEIFRAAVLELEHCGWLENFDDNYLYVQCWDDGIIYRYNYVLNGSYCEIDQNSAHRVARGGYIEFEKVDEEVGKLEKLEEENSKLKEKLAHYEEEEKEEMIEKIIAKVVDVLSPERISELREEAKEYCLDELPMFENKVKAEAFECMQEMAKEQKYSFERMPIVEPKKTSKYGW